MFSLFISLYAMTLFTTVVILVTETTMENSFFKIVLSPLEYKILGGLTWLVFLACLSPLVYLLGRDLIAGEPKAYFLVSPLVIVGLASLYSTIEERRNKRV